MIPWSRLEIVGLSFAYPKSPPLSRSINLNVQVGRVTGLWRPSGAGKSTLVRLLQRHYLPLSGSITLDGKALHEFSLNSVRRSIAVVPREIKIFNATLAENILMGRKTGTRDEVAAITSRFVISSGSQPPPPC